MLRASMETVPAEEYIRTARAFGLRQRLVVFVYALKNACLFSVGLRWLPAGGFSGPSSLVLRPSAASAEESHAQMERGRIAAALPRLTAIARDSRREIDASSRVRGIASAIRPATGFWNRKDWPKSPLAAPDRKVASCAISGRSVPNSWRYCSITSGRAKTGARIRAGSPAESRSAGCELLRYLLPV